MKAPLPDLDTLATRINEAHQAYEDAKKSSLERAIEAGKLLLEAKKQLKHGEWEGWLKKNCKKIQPRTARLYMQLAANPKLATDAVLTLQEAARGVSSKAASSSKTSSKTSATPATSSKTSTAPTLFIVPTSDKPPQSEAKVDSLDTAWKYADSQRRLAFVIEHLDDIKILVEKANNGEQPVSAQKLEAIAAALQPQVG
jgi:hypothetical protein